MAMRVAMLISSGSTTSNTTSTGAVTKGRLCGGLPEAAGCTLLAEARMEENRRSELLPSRNLHPGVTCLRKKNPVPA